MKARDGLGAVTLSSSDMGRLPDQALSDLALFFDARERYVRLARTSLTHVPEEDFGGPLGWTRIHGWAALEFNPRASYGRMVQRCGTIARRSHRRQS